MHSIMCVCVCVISQDGYVGVSRLWQSAFQNLIKSQPRFVAPFFLSLLFLFSFAFFLSIMFEKTLTDLIRGIRANKKNEQKYISVCLQEIRNEVKSNDADIKAMAVAKLTYVRRNTWGIPVLTRAHYLFFCFCYSFKCLAMICLGPLSTLLKSCPALAFFTNEAAIWPLLSLSNKTPMSSCWQQILLKR